MLCVWRGRGGCEWVVGCVTTSPHHAISPPSRRHATPPGRHAATPSHHRHTAAARPPLLTPHTAHHPTSSTQRIRPIHPFDAFIMGWRGAGLGWRRGGPPATPGHFRLCQLRPPGRATLQPNPTTHTRPIPTRPYPTTRQQHDSNAPTTTPQHHINTTSSSINTITTIYHNDTNILTTA